jgi:hypothetical protein
MNGTIMFDYYTGCILCYSLDDTKERIEYIMKKIKYNLTVKLLHSV